MENALIPHEEMRTMSKEIVASGLFPSMKKPEQVMTLMLLCQSEGLHPIKALQQYHIINGTPSKKAEVLLAEYKNRGGKVKWLKYDDSVSEAVFTTPDGSELQSSWTIERAKKAGLMNNQNWQKYPRAMLRCRLISEMITTLMPEIKAGVQVYEEVQDMAGPEIKPPVDTDCEVVDDNQRKPRSSKSLTEHKLNVNEGISEGKKLASILATEEFINSSNDSVTEEPDGTEIKNGSLPPEQPEPTPEINPPSDFDISDLEGSF